jgi:hypothetical protein
MPTRSATPWRRSRRAGVVHGGRRSPKLTDGLHGRAHSLKPPAPGEALPLFRCDNPSRAFFFPVTPDEVRHTLARLPARHTEELTHVWFRRVSAREFAEGRTPLAEFVRGSGVAAIILYPWPTDRLLRFGHRATPAAVLRFYRPWQPTQVSDEQGQALCFTAEALRHFYLEHLLLHEVGHLVDSRRGPPSRARARRAESVADSYAVRWSAQGRVEFVEGDAGD